MLGRKPRKREKEAPSHEQWLGPEEAKAARLHSAMLVQIRTLRINNSKED
jgi:hypothetical protein